MVTHEHEVLEITEEVKYAIAIAVEMDCQMIKTSRGGW